MIRKKTTEEIWKIFNKNKIRTKILAASFRNTRQVVEAILAGADAVTVSHSVLKMFSENPLVETINKGFADDWKKIYYNNSLCSLLTSDTRKFMEDFCEDISLINEQDVNVNEFLYSRGCGQFESVKKTL